jgi:hypothetical protein
VYTLTNYPAVAAVAPLPNKARLAIKGARSLRTLFSLQHEEMAGSAHCSEARCNRYGWGGSEALGP